MAKAKGLFNDLYQSAMVDVDPTAGKVTYKNKTYETKDLDWRVPVTGTVYGAALNYKGELEAMGDRLYEDPYKAPPQAPILYIKPINTFTPYNGTIPMPTGETELQIGAALGVVFKKTATRVQADEAFDYVEGFTIVNDVSLPHESVHRPAIKQKARDGFCPIGPWIIKADEVEDADNLKIHVFINETLKQTNTTKNLVRSVNQLIQDTTEFMTFHEGDVLLVGTPENPPRATEGDMVRIEIENIGPLQNKILAE